jgi:hypothetical protein
MRWSMGLLLVAAPVGAGHPHQLEVTEERAGVRHVGPAAEVDEARVAGERRLLPRLRRRVLVGADHAGGGGRHGVVGLPLDDLQLEAVSGEHLTGAVLGELVAHERLGLGQDLPHPGLDAVEVLGYEGAGAAVGARRELEVVVEAVLHRRADGERGAGEQLQHRLGHHVGGGVADRVQPTLGRGRDDLDLVAVGQLPVEVALGAVHHPDDGVLGQSAADPRGQLDHGGAGGNRSLRVVGQRDRDVGHRRMRRRGTSGPRMRFRAEPGAPLLRT